MSIESEFNEYVELLESLDELRDSMTSPADIQHGISAIAMTLELVKKANKLIKDGNGLEAREIVLSLQEQILNTKSLLIETKGKVIELEEENLKLRDRLRTKENPVGLISGEDELWYVEGSNNPVCKTCRGDSGDPIELSWVQYLPANSLFGKGKYECPKCGFKKTV